MLLCLNYIKNIHAKLIKTAEYVNFLLEFHIHENRKMV